MRLKDKIALITGSARGIGQATAELFHKEGAIVIISDIRDNEGEEIAQKLGERVEYIQLDVRDENSWSRAAEYIKNKFGRLDILVNNAGITGFLESTGPWDAENSDLESWEEIFLQGAGLLEYQVQLHTLQAKLLYEIILRVLRYIVLKKDIKSDVIVFTQQQ